MKVLLDFIYGAAIHLKGGLAMEVLKLANFYEVLKLREEVKAELVKSLDTENVLETLVEVDRCITEDEGMARTTIVNFIKTNIKKGMEGEDWKAFVNNHGYLVTIIMKAVVDRIELLH